MRPASRNAGKRGKPSGKQGIFFPEMKILAGKDEAYVMLYHCLQYPRVDDRLRVFREITAKECLPWNMEETEAARLGRWLSKAALSSYMERDFAMIDGLKADLAVKLLIHREELDDFCRMWKRQDRHPASLPSGYSSKFPKLGRIPEPSLKKRGNMAENEGRFSTDGFICGRKSGTDSEFPVRGRSGNHNGILSGSKR